MAVAAVNRVAGCPNALTKDPRDNKQPPTKPANISTPNSERSILEFSILESSISLSLARRKRPRSLVRPKRSRIAVEMSQAVKVRTKPKTPITKLPSAGERVSIDFVLEASLDQAQ